MRVIGRWVAAILGHFRDQKRSQSDATDSGNEAEYDDRESIPPLVQEEQRLERLAHQPETNKENSETAHQRELVKWTKILAWVTGALATATFVVAAFSGWQVYEMRKAGQDTKNAVEATNRLAAAAEQSRDIANSARQDSRETLERNQRAWIGPVDAEIGPDDIPLTVRPAKIPLRVIYQNTGREPALDVTIHAIGGIVPVPLGFRDWDHLQIPQNKTCEGLSPVRGNIVVYPSTTSSPANDIRITATIKDGENAVNELTNGKQILWINGCIAYTTIKTPHQSAFCFFLFPDLTKSFAKWHFNGCGTGNWAN